MHTGRWELEGSEGLLGEDHVERFARQNGHATGDE